MGKKNESRNAGVRKKIRAYFEECDSQGKKYTYPGLQVALGVKGEVMEEWSRDSSLGPDMELAKARIRDGLEQREDQMALFLRRQDSGPGGGQTVETRVYFETAEDLEDYGA